MKSDLISIIVPIYNVEKYLNRCLKSIQNQTYKNIEVIMVNDGSRDHSELIAKKFENDRRFKLYKKINGGLSDARNFGLQFVKGNFVCFVDSDDFIDNSYVEKLYKAFDECTDVVIGNYVIYDENHKKAYSHSIDVTEKVFSSTEEKRQLLEQTLLSGSFYMPVWKNMYRVDFITNCRLKFISERIIYAEDKLFNMKAYWYAKKIKVVNSNIYYHLIVSGSLSQGYRENYYDMCKKQQEYIDYFLDEIGQLDIKKYIHKHLANLVASSVLVMTKCKYEIAYRNIKSIIEDEYTVNIFNDHTQKPYLKRYKLIYLICKTKNVLLIYFCLKFIHSMESYYRLLQKKNTIILENNIQDILNI